MSHVFESAPGPENEAATPLRFVTAASLFDGHDAAINIMRRLIQAQGAEVIHLGHNRSVLDIVRAAIQEDADAIAISSYQGGHVEFFRYMVDLLKERGAEHIRVFGGGGGTITLEEISELQDYGVERIYHPEDGHGNGPGGDDRGRGAACSSPPLSPPCILARSILMMTKTIANVISALEDEVYTDAELKAETPGVGGRPQAGAGHRYHRHRRSRKIIGDR